MPKQKIIEVAKNANAIRAENEDLGTAVPPRYNLTVEKELENEKKSTKLPWIGQYTIGVNSDLAAARTPSSVCPRLRSTPT